MTTFFLCYLGPEYNQPKAWLQAAVERAGGLTALAISALQLPIARAGSRGIFADNPSIDRIDAMQMQAQSLGYPIRALRLPIQFPENAALGTEISAINGWTDMACYMGLEVIHVVPQFAGPFLPSHESMLHEVLNYMQEMELGAALSWPDTAPVTPRGLFETGSAQFAKPAGLALPYRAGLQDEARKLFSEALSAVALTIHDSEFNENLTKQAIADHAKECFGQPPAYLFLEIEA